MLIPLPEGLVGGAGIHVDGGSKIVETTWTVRVMVVAVVEIVRMVEVRVCVTVFVRVVGMGMDVIWPPNSSPSQPLTTWTSCTHIRWSRAPTDCARGEARTPPFFHTAKHGKAWSSRFINESNVHAGGLRNTAQGCFLGRWEER